LPVIGLLSSVPETLSDEFAAFRRGLAETGHVEGRNVVFEYRTVENHFDRLPALADDLVRRRVAAIFTAVNVNPALAAKAASRVTPIVFFMGADPVLSGVVASLSRPGGNITGVISPPPAAAVGAAREAAVPKKCGQARLPALPASPNAEHAMRLIRMGRGQKRPPIRSAVKTDAAMAFGWA
jgi:putative tryptophan/tyrosine transport system substrate-binding protein